MARILWSKLLQASGCLLVFLGLAADSASAAPPAVIGHFDSNFSGNAQDFDSRDNLGCLVTRGGRDPEFRVLDLQNPVNPTVLGSLDFDDHLNRIVLQNGLAYVATSMREQELVIVDVSDPPLPRIVGGYDLERAKDAISVAIAGSVLFVGTRRSSRTDGHELHILDVSNPLDPVLLASIDLGAHVNDLVLEGNVLYAATSHNTKEVIAFDVSVPAAISELGSIDLSGSYDALGIDVHRGVAYVVRRGHRDNFVVLDAGTLTRISARNLDARGVRVRVHRDRAYVASRESSAALQVVDVADPKNPHVLHRLDGPSATTVHVDPPRTYLTSRENREALLVLDTEALLRPNILVIYTDDQHLESVAFMPSLKELANRGLTFRQSFVTTPSCGPSRASLLTGLYAHNHGAISTFGGYIGEGPGAIGSEESTIATWLQGAGYRTAFIGKYINGFQHNCVNGSCYVPPGWDDWQVAEGGTPNHVYYDHNISNNGTLESYGNAPEDYSTDVLAQKALDFLESQDSRPFFMILSFNAPHLGSAISVPPAPRHVGAFAGIPPWRPPSYDEEDVSDKPSLVAQRPRAADTFATFFTYGSWTDLLRRQQLESLLSVDEAIDELLQELGRMGEYEDTVVIFTSDNGYFWGEHRGWGGKGLSYEESMRVPMIVAYPRLIEPGTEDSTNMVLNIDLAPTIAELAGTSPGGPVDGESFVSLLMGEAGVPWRTDFLVEQYAGAAAYQAVRSTSMKYAYYLDLDEDELYDHGLDVYEMQSQASNPLYDSARLYFQNRINQLMTNDALRTDF